MKMKPFLETQWRGPECVFIWENINELVPTGWGAMPIISSWENTRGKLEREEKVGREMKGGQFWLFVPTDSSKSEAPCCSSLQENSSKALFGLITVMGRPPNLPLHTIPPHTDGP